MTEGERWTRDLLARLRAGGYGPRAWRRFLAESARRSARDAALRPAALRGVSLLAAAGAIAWGAAIAVAPATGLAGLAWWAVVTAMAAAHLGMLESPGGVPLARLGPANALCLARLAVVPALPALSRPALAAALAALALADMVDGPIARRRGEVSRFGVWLDPAADTIVLGAAAIALAGAAALPWWLAGALLARAAAPWIGLTAVYLAAGAGVDRSRHVSGRAPGAVVTLGLIGAAAGVPAAIALTAAGLAGALAALLLSAGRIRLDTRAGSTPAGGRS